MKREICPTVRPWRVCEKKDRKEQSKSHTGLYISPTWGGAPTKLICTKMCTVVAVPNLIMTSSAQSFELKFPGITVLQGVKFVIFLLILAWALQQ